MVLIALINSLISSEAFKGSSWTLPTPSLVDELVPQVKTPTLSAQCIVTIRTVLVMTCSPTRQPIQQLVALLELLEEANCV